MIFNITKNVICCNLLENSTTVSLGKEISFLFDLDKYNSGSRSRVFYNVGSLESNEIINIGDIVEFLVNKVKYKCNIIDADFENSTRVLYIDEDLKMDTKKFYIIKW